MATKRPATKIAAEPKGGPHVVSHVPYPIEIPLNEYAKNDATGQVSIARRHSVTLLPNRSHRIIDGGDVELGEIAKADWEKAKALAQTRAMLDSRQLSERTI